MNCLSETTLRYFSDRLHQSEVLSTLSKTQRLHTLFTVYYVALLLSLIGAAVLLWFDPMVAESYHDGSMLGRAKLATGALSPSVAVAGITNIALVTYMVLFVVALWALRTHGICNASVQRLSRAEPNHYDAIVAIRQWFLHQQAITWLVGYFVLCTLLVTALLNYWVWALLAILLSYNLWVLKCYCQYQDTVEPVFHD